MMNIFWYCPGASGRRSSFGDDIKSLHSRPLVTVRPGSASCPPCFPGSHRVCQRTRPYWSCFVAFECRQLHSLQSALTVSQPLPHRGLPGRRAKEGGSSKGKALVSSQRPGQANTQCPDSTLGLGQGCQPPPHLCCKEVNGDLPR